MSEPGVNLGRLVAAERNAMTGVDIGKKAQAEVVQLVGRIEQLEQKIVEYDNALNILRQHVYSNLGNVRTG